MISVVKSLGATTANGALTLHTFNVDYNGTLLGATSTDGYLTDVDSAAFVILDNAGAQIYPVSGHQALNVVDAPPTGHRLSAGRYAAVWMPGGPVTVGQYFVRWFFVRNGAAEESFDQEFEVVTLPYNGRNYSTIYDLRAEGLTTVMASDVQAQALIVKASAYAEHFTGRRFLPEYKTIDIDGTGGRAVLLDEPIVALQEIKLNFVTNFVAQDLLIPGQTLKVFNRHITKNLVTPDDRENPKVEFVHGADLTGVNYYESGTGYVLYQLLFPPGRQNVRLTGVFGFTEFDGSINSVGRTPLMLREATKMLAFRNRAPMINRPLAVGAGPAGPMLEEHTRDQGVTYQASWLRGAFTGNAEIDQLLAAFVRPPKFGAA